MCFRNTVFFFILLLGTLPTFAAETVKFENEIKQSLIAPFDAALMANGELIVLDSGNKVIIFDGNSQEQITFSLNNIIPAAPAIVPRAIALAPQGRMVVADPANSRIQVFNLAGELQYQFGAPGTLPGQFKTLSSIDVDTFGFVYATDQENKRLQIFSPNGIFMKAIPLSGAPVDVAVDYRGNIYVLIPEISKIEKFSSDGKKIADITCRMNNKDELSKATRIQVDPWGNIYLTQSLQERIVKSDANGQVLIAFGSEGNGRGQFHGISGIVADESGRLYVTDSGNGRVQIFKINGPAMPILSKVRFAPLFVDFETTLEAEDAISDIFSLPGRGLFTISDKKAHVLISNGELSTIGSEGSGAGQFANPTAIYVTLDGRIYVADTANHRVQIFNVDGSLSYQFGKFGNKPGQFNMPQGIAVNGKGIIFVADTLNNRIQMFNQDGIYLNVIGRERAGPTGKGDSCQNLNLPKAIAIDSKDQLYVLDADMTQVKVFDENGDCLKTIGQKGSGLGQFTKSVDLTLDQNDNLYVADAIDNRVQIFDPNGRFLLAFGSVGVGDGYFKQISAIAATEGKIYVADYLSDKIQVFKYSPDGLIGKTERLNTTKTAPPPPGKQINEVFKFNMARKSAYIEATNEFAENLGFSQGYLRRFVRIESVESLNDGHVKVTISIPKHIPKEIAPVDGAGSQ